MHGTSSTTLLLQWASHTMVYGTRMTTNLLVNPSARQRICTGATLLHNDMHATAHPHPSASLATIALLNTLADTDRHNTDPQSLSLHTSASAPAPPTFKLVEACRRSPQESGSRIQPRYGNYILLLPWTKLARWSRFRCMLLVIKYAFCAKSSPQSQSRPARTTVNGGFDRSEIASRALSS